MDEGAKVACAPCEKRWKPSVREQVVRHLENGPPGGAGAEDDG